MSASHIWTWPFSLISTDYYPVGEQVNGLPGRVFSLKLDALGCNKNCNNIIGETINQSIKQSWFFMPGSYFVTWLYLQRIFRRSWTQFNRCELFVVNLWRLNLYRIRILRKYELGLSCSFLYTVYHCLQCVFNVHLLNNHALYII